MISLAGKTALVTGATGGLGREIASLLAAEKCQMILTGRANGARGPGMGYGPDFSDSMSYCFFTEHCREYLAIDVVVNCAGIFPQGHIEKADRDSWDNCFSINVKAPFMLMRAIMPGMAERGWGRVLNICSTSAHAGFANSSIYCASKHALLGLSRALDEEFKDRGVRVMTLSPGSMKTDMGRKVQGQDWDTFLEPKDVAETVMFMLKSEHGPVEVVQKRRVVR